MNQENIELPLNALILEGKIIASRGLPSLVVVSWSIFPVNPLVDFIIRITQKAIPFRNPACPEVTQCQTAIKQGKRTVVKPPKELG